MTHETLSNRKPAEIEDDEYAEFYKSITKDSNGPLTQTHFIAEGEVVIYYIIFNFILFIKI